MSTPGPQATRSPAVPTPGFADLLVTMSAIADQAGRDDLVRRLDGATTRVTDQRLRIVVVGQLKQGKSQFVNSLLNAPVCAVGDDETTAVPTLVQYAEQPAARLVLGGAGGLRDSGDASADTVDVSLDAITTITPTTPLAGGREVQRLEVDLPSPLLRDGLVLVDTPGVGGHGHPYAAATLGMIPAADAVFVVSDASQEYTEPEMSFIRQVTGLCPTVAGLVTKTDLYPHWRAIVEADRGHLAAEGLDIPLLPISSVLRAHALRLSDESLNAEAGFTELYEFLRDRVVADARSAARAAAASELRSVSEHLALKLGSELTALKDPETAATAVDGLSRAKLAAEEMRRNSAHWQQTLADGITDLAADIDHDLRDRLRAVTREAERAIDAGDPGKDWDRLGEWLAEQVAAVVGDNFVWAHERALWLAEQVAEHFAAAGHAHLPVLDSVDTDGLFDAVTELSDLESGRTSIVQKALVGMRGSYGGVLMFGLISTMVGMALINPVSVGAGLLLGSKAYRDDREHRILERRQKAKIAVRAFTDDVSFQVGKESRDRLRMVQRQLRDHFTEVADQAARSVAESLRAAQSAASLESGDRTRRTAELENQLHTVAALRRAVDQLQPPPPELSVDTPPADKPAGLA
ncbi:dynamin family protein [Williamsia sterculiae]|uniref:Dynamin family protein n=1 Tax=Williamsia sterculiae TaxID=1344003 RepID=A0A1N7CJU8_9NOCA|nr:dynamin family protein [Williamsia sterculiae]SIR63795.1 Dynamin family protein [Williamsia sterculiae]